MRLINDLIVENNGTLIVIPGGTTILEADGQPMEWPAFDKNLLAIIVSNREVIADKTKVYEEEVEGTRRDVDDWDMHKALVLEGEFVFNTSINFEGLFKEMALWIMDNRWDGYELSEYVREQSAEILDAFAEELAEASGKWHRENKDGMVILGSKLDGDIIKLRIKLIFNRSIINPDPFYRGTYNRGGRYPDA